jgi:hypothetical protein
MGAAEVGSWNMGSMVFFFLFLGTTLTYLPKNCETHLKLSFFLIVRPPSSTVEKLDLYYFLIINFV